MNSPDIIYMIRSIELAELGLGQAAPNPLVGSVIVYKDKIIGEGYHQKWGNAHAEVNAINSVKDKSLLKKSTLYVNLEPCAHFGKTPPCANLIAEKQIPRVVIGCVDSFAKVAGKGIEILKNAGCEVELGVLENESRELNRRFFTFHEKKRPFIILKWAETLDGFIDIERNQKEPIGQYWITNNLAKMLVHKWRSEESAFMVGTNTARNDNPRLTVRDWKGRNPLRIVTDKKLSLPGDLYLFDEEANTLVFNSIKNEHRSNIEFVKTDFSNYNLEQVLNALYDRQIQSLVVEGGQKLLKSFINQNLWDEARVFTGNTYFKKGTKSPEFKELPVSETMVGDSKLRLYRKA